jgi:predicted Zn-dependent protease
LHDLCLNGYENKPVRLSILRQEVATPIFFEREQYNEAIRLWEDALSKNSGLVLVGTNLAMAQWRVGNRQAASPGFQPAVDLLRRFRIERGQ